MNAAGSLGISILAAAVVVVLVGLVAVLPSLVSLRRRALVLEATVASEVGLLYELSLARDEIFGELNANLVPYRRLRRVLMHPLTVALIESYRRRRARR